MKKILSFIISVVALFQVSFSQQISGTVTDETGVPIPYASILIKGTTKGVSANNNASYTLSVNPGRYKIVCQHIGFETAEKIVELIKDTVVNFKLKVQYLNMPLVVIDNKGENPAYEIIRQAIKKREYYNNQVKQYSCDLYTKDVIKLLHMPDRMMGNLIDNENKKNMASTLKLDSGGKGMIYLSEAMSKLYSKGPGKFKLDVQSSRVSGSNRFGFTFPVFINMYQNNVDVMGEGMSSRGFVSPIADGALRYYKYKLLGSFEENGKFVYTILVTPKRVMEPLFTGTINISDESYNIHSYDLWITKSAQLDLLDTLRISQLYIPLENEIFRLKNQLLTFSLGIMNFRFGGSFLSVYSNYDVKPIYSKDIFGKVIIRYDTAVDKKPRSFWDTSRPVPLNDEEIRDYRIKDSIHTVTLDSIARNNNRDSLRKHQPRFKWSSIFFPGVDRMHYGRNSNWNWGMDALLLSCQYNTVEGLNLELSPFWEKKFNKGKKTVLFMPYFRYGFANNHFNSWSEVSFSKRKIGKDKNVTSRSWILSGGKKISQFNIDNPISPSVNTFSTLLDGLNVMKIYEKYYAGAGFVKKYSNGSRLNLKAIFEDRFSLQNVTKYTFKRSDSLKITSNIPECVNLPPSNTRNQAFLFSIDYTFQPGSKFIEFPERKIPIGSKYPTFRVSYSKGINGLFGSDVDFDKWGVDVADEMNFKLGGLLKYKLSFGGFLNRKKLYIQDLRHFNSNSIKALSSYVDGFQMLDSYIYSNAAPFLMEAHLEHHANGLLTNKIPFIKKLGWNLVAGGNAFFISNKDHYEELYVGLENILKILRVDFVTAFRNGAYQQSAFVVGTDGLLGSGFQSLQFNNRKVDIVF